MMSRVIPSLVIVLSTACGDDDDGKAGSLEDACFVRSPENDQACAAKFTEKQLSFANVQGQPEFDCGGVDRTFEETRSLADDFGCFYCGADEYGMGSSGCPGFSDDNYWCCP